MSRYIKLFGKKAKKAIENKIDRNYLLLTSKVLGRYDGITHKAYCSIRQVDRKILETHICKNQFVF